MKKILILLLCWWCHTMLMAQQATDFTVTDSDGIERTLYADYLDQGKTVVIEFFFTTCPPCNTIAPMLVPLYEDWGNGELDVEFISLSVQTWDTNANVAIFKETHGHTFPGAGFDGGAYSAAYPYLNGDFPFYGATPTFAVVSPNGDVDFDPKGDTFAATIDSLEVSIAATGARKRHTLQGQVVSASGKGLDDFQLIINTDTIAVDTIFANGTFEVEVLMNQTDNYSIRPYRNNSDDWPLGISTFDIVLTQKNILGLSSFEYELQGIAADINNSSSISTADLVMMRQIILGIPPDLTQLPPWKFFNQSTGTATYEIQGGSIPSLDFHFTRQGDASLSYGN